MGDTFLLCILYEVKTHAIKWLNLDAVKKRQRAKEKNREEKNLNLKCGF